MTGQKPLPPTASCPTNSSAGQSADPALADQPSLSRVLATPGSSAGRGLVCNGMGLPGPLASKNQPMDIELSKLIIPAIAGLISGAIGSLIAPWVNWGEKQGQTTFNIA